MMEENNDIFLAGSEALVYLTVPMHKKNSTKFVWGHPFSTNFSTPHPSPLYAFRVTVSAIGLFQKFFQRQSHIFIE